MNELSLSQEKIVHLINSRISLYKQISEELALEKISVKEPSSYEGSRLIKSLNALSAKYISKIAELSNLRDEIIYLGEMECEAKND